MAPDGLRYWGEKGTTTEEDSPMDERDDDDGNGAYGARGIEGRLISRTLRLAGAAVHIH